MKILILTAISQESSEKLADRLKQDGHQVVIKTAKAGDYFSGFGFDLIFSYGSAAESHPSVRRINESWAVKECIDKHVTFFRFDRKGIPRPASWKTPKHIPDNVEWLVVRKKKNGSKAEDLSYWSKESGEPIPEAQLYTEYYDHKRELRVTYIMGEVFVYRKDLKDGYHSFNLTHHHCYKKIKEDAAKAANALEMEFVSFDVLYNSPDKYCFLEANSGSIYQDEVGEVLSNYLKGI